MKLNPRMVLLRGKAWYNQVTMVITPHHRQTAFMAMDYLYTVQQFCKHYLLTLPWQKKRKEKNYEPLKLSHVMSYRNWNIILVINYK